MADLDLLWAAMEGAGVSAEEEDEAEEERRYDSSDPTGMIEALLAGGSGKPTKNVCSLPSTTSSRCLLSPVYCIPMLPAAYCLLA
jgi:hypothetical protein